MAGSRIRCCARGKRAQILNPGYFDLFRCGGHMPERDAWQSLCEAMQDGRRDVAALELAAIDATLRRRSRGEALPVDDLYPEEHRLAPYPEWGEAWNAYKGAVRAGAWASARRSLDELVRLLEAAP